MFNDGRYWERAQAGEFTQIILDGRLAPPDSGEPAGSLSLAVAYVDSENVEIARVHLYLRQDGSIGASGRPDPKRLLKDGILYRLQRKSGTP